MSFLPHLTNASFQLVINAAKSAEVVSSLFPDRVRNQVLDQTNANTRRAKDKHMDEAQPVLAELYPNTTVRKLSIQLIVFHFLCNRLTYWLHFCPQSLPILQDSPPGPPPELQSRYFSCLRRYLAP